MQSDAVLQLDPYEQLLQHRPVRKETPHRGGCIRGRDWASALRHVDLRDGASLARHSSRSIVGEWHGDDDRGIARSLPASRNGREDFLLIFPARGTLCLPHPLQLH